jgi:hypothetical protein
MPEYKLVVRRYGNNTVRKTASGRNLGRPLVAECSHSGQFPKLSDANSVQFTKDGNRGLISIEALTRRHIGYEFASPLSGSTRRYGAR